MPQNITVLTVVPFEPVEEPDEDEQIKELLKRSSVLISEVTDLFEAIKAIIAEKKCKTNQTSGTVDIIKIPPAPSCLCKSSKSIVPPCQIHIEQSAISGAQYDSNVQTREDKNEDTSKLKESPDTVSPDENVPESVQGQTRLEDVSKKEASDVTNSGAEDMKGVTEIQEETLNIVTGDSLNNPTVVHEIMTSKKVTPTCAVYEESRKALVCSCKGTEKKEESTNTKPISNHDDSSKDVKACICAPAKRLEEPVESIPITPNSEACKVVARLHRSQPDLRVPCKIESK